MRAILDCSQGLLVLALYLETILVEHRGTFGVLVIEVGLAACKATTLHALLSLQPLENKFPYDKLLISK